MINSVWLLTEQQDYESEDTLSVYRNKPSEQELLSVLTGHYKHEMEDEELLKLANELHSKCHTEVWGPYTCRLTEWELK